MILRWSPEAADDLEEIVEFIRSDRPKAARRVGRAIYAAIGQLAEFPHAGRSGLRSGTRELVVAPLPYVVVYRLKNENVEIIRIRHAAQARGTE